MSISNKYNIPQETVKRMVQDGILSSKWPMYEEVYSMYKSSSAKSKSQIFLDISMKTNIPENTVKYIVSVMDKI